MKKAILTLGLFSMMMLLTSFTTTEKSTNQATYDQVETGGICTTMTKTKRADFNQTDRVEYSSTFISSDSYKILYNRTEIKKLD